MSPTSYRAAPPRGVSRNVPDPAGGVNPGSACAGSPALDEHGGAIVGGRGPVGEGRQRPPERDHPPGAEPLAGGALGVDHAVREHREDIAGLHPDRIPRDDREIIEAAQGNGVRLERLARARSRAVVEERPLPAAEARESPRAGIEYA